MPELFTDPELKKWAERHRDCNLNVENFIAQRFIYYMVDKKLKNCFKLSSKITVYIPSTMNINKEIDITEYVNKTANLLSECFGGATSTPALGYWTSPTTGLVKEKTRFSFCLC